MALTQVNPGDTIYPSTINQFLYVLQQPAGAQDAGHYIIEHNSYVSGAFMQTYCIFRSRVSVPVSVTAGTGEVSTTNCVGPTTANITAGGAQIYTSSNAINVNAHCGGTTTIQY